MNAWDFFSDFFFTISLWDNRKLHDDIIYLFIAAVGFVLIPWGLNLYTLLQFQQRWQNSIYQTRLRGWITSFFPHLCILSFISGSSFGAVELCNSNLFNIEFFSMGLSQTELREFGLKKLFTVVVAENVPQLAIRFVETNFFFLFCFSFLNFCLFLTTN